MTTEGLNTRTSSHSASETLARLTAALEHAGLTIFAHIDHAAAARDVGMDLSPADVVIFGNPRAGTPLMADRPEIAIDLPLKMLVWTGAGDVVSLSYLDPLWLAERHGLSAGLLPQITAMSDALDAIAAKVAAA